jgi:hypothetical protein
VTNVDRAVLEKHWVHSHEEDTESELVFRPASYAFPRCRGRSALDLRSDGSYSESVPGPPALPETADGNRELDDGRLRLKQADGSTRVLELVSATSDRLVVRK